MGTSKASRRSRYPPTTARNGARPFGAPPACSRCFRLCDRLAESAATIAQRLLGQREAISAHIEGLKNARFGGSKIRHHGDFHLGQVLIAKDDAYILDFEGEPRQSLDQRRGKAPPARDVAGFLRSIDYATSAAIDRAPNLTAEERPVLAQRIRSGAPACPGRSGIPIGRRSPRRDIWPADETQARQLLDIFQLEKAFYEIEYELTNRPTWTHIPLDGTWRILEAARGGAMSELSAGAREIIAGRNADPFHYLGPHTEDDHTVVRVFLPDASRVFAISNGSERELERIDPAGLFAGPLDDPEHYRLRARFGDNEVELEDPYRFPPVLSDFDLYLLGEGNHLTLYDKLGAHPMELEGVHGVAFVVWAPNARRVSVVGDFNFWDGRRHAMRVRGNGYWEIFVPGAAAGDKYKYEIIARAGELLMKADPVGFGSEMRPLTASVVIDSAKLPRPPPPQTSIPSAHRCRSTRFISAPGGAKASMANTGSPIANWPSSCRPMPPTWDSPMSNCCQ